MAETMKPLTIHEKAALWDAVHDMARLRGVVVIIDRLESALVQVGGEHQTSDGATTEQAVAEAAWKMGLDAKPLASSLPLTRDTQPCTVLPDTEEGGP